VFSLQLHNGPRGFFTRGQICHILVHESGVSGWAITGVEQIEVRSRLQCTNDELRVDGIDHFAVNLELVWSIDGETIVSVGSRLHSGYEAEEDDCWSQAGSKRRYWEWSLLACEKTGRIRLSSMTKKLRRR